MFDLCFQIHMPDDMRVKTMQFAYEAFLYAAGSYSYVNTLDFGATSKKTAAVQSFDSSTTEHKNECFFINIFQQEVGKRKD